MRTEFDPNASEGFGFRAPPGSDTWRIMKRINQTRPRTPGRSPKTAAFFRPHRSFARFPSEEEEDGGGLAGDPGACGGGPEAPPSSEKPERWWGDKMQGCSLQALVLSRRKTPFLCVFDPFPCPRGVPARTSVSCECCRS
ncbi:hypothetical protein Taro_048069 [Colocasia esculenta]|uniref:Uncharacterized protein n=1 Tax=Colocasia esculenta TaxID=4460 RepID=A0A843X7M8_COLES|nr:hypothetical protein [Colocasia esculenta]